MGHLLAIDAGTGGCRAAVFTDEGRPVVDARRNWSQAADPRYPGSADFDTSCAAVGAGAVAPGIPLLACGSWESLVAPATRVRSRALAAAGLAVGPHPSLPGIGVWARSPNGTAAVDWARRLTGVPLRSLDRRLASSGPDPSPVLAVPHLSGAITPWSALKASWDRCSG